MTLILIPCKNLDVGKSRLAGVLDDLGRRSLCEQFLRRTLTTAIEGVGRLQVRTITSDPRAVEVARSLGVQVILDAGWDLNSALAQARVSLLSEGIAERCLIVPIDLPHLDAELLQNILGQTGNIVLVPDCRRAGTNVLGLDPAPFRNFPFLFGTGSFEKHVAAARNLGFEAQIVLDPNLGFDVDEPNDYRKWLQEAPS